MPSPPIKASKIAESMGCGRPTAIRPKAPTMPMAAFDETPSLVLLVLVDERSQSVTGNGRPQNLMTLGNSLARRSMKSRKTSLGKPSELADHLSADAMINLARRMR
jgi:hypothetical protein